MNKNINFIIIVLVCSSCSSISSMEFWGSDETSSPKHEFLKESAEEPLNVPENIDLIESDNHYPYFSNFEIEGNVDVPKPRQIFSSGGESSVQLRRLGELMWIYIETLPSTTWPISKNYWDTSIYSVLSADPDLGIIKIDYSQDLLLEMRIEHGIKEASSEIFLFKVEKSSGELVSNPDFIQKELESVVEYLSESVGSFSGTSLAAQNLNERKKANIFSENGQTVIELDLNFDRAWSSVSRALTAGNIVSNDRDRSSGIFYVSYGVEDDEGFFSFLGFRNVDEGPDFSKEAQFEINITQKNNKSYVRARSLDGNIDDSEQLLSKINELLS